MSGNLRRSMQVEIADADRQLFAGTCYSLIAPAALGEVCILPRHAPLLTKLVPGEIRLQTEQEGSLHYYVSGGYMEVQHCAVTILADRMLRSGELDRESAEEAKRKAQEVLKKSSIFSERSRAEAELIKALAQLRVLEHLERARLHKLRR
ncbi:MAG: ATP synthase F1 subunit epsilon [Methylococcaceae bacterium]|nr:ATP synthase F1 subunit epsilon [Methylococcaceae bacterium]